MSYWSCKASAFAVLALFTMTSSLAGCQSILQTLGTGTTGQAEVVDQAVVADVCSAWPNVSYSGADTEQTQREARANNAARAEYCAP